MSKKSELTKGGKSMKILQEHPQLLEPLLSSSFDAIIAIDTRKKIFIFNRQAEELLGYHESEILGKSIRLFHEDENKAREIYKTINDLGEIKSDNIFLKDKKGRRISVSLSGKQILNEKGESLGQVGFLREFHDAYSIKDQLDTLIATSKALTSTKDVREILMNLIRSALRVIPSAERGAIHLFDTKSRKLNLFVSSYDYSKNAWDAFSFEVGEGILGRVYKDQKAINCEDPRNDSRFIRISGSEVKNDGSILCAPVTGKKKIGVISLSNSQSTHAFSNNDLNILVDYATQAAIAIENTEQIKHTKEVVEELEVLQSITLKLNALKDTKEILGTILESGNRLFGSEMAVIHWCGRSGERTQTYTVPEELQALMTAPRPAGGLTDEIFRNNKPIIVPDTTQDDRVNSEVRKAGIKSLVGFPLSLEQKVAGVLFLNSKEKQNYSEHAVKLLASILPAAAVAIENANIIEMEHLSKTLVKVSGVLAAEQDLNKQLDVLKEFMRKELSAPMFYLGLYDSINEVIRLRINVEDGMDQKLHDISLTGRKEDTISTFVVKNRKSLIWFSELEKKNDCKNLEIDPLKIGKGCESCLALPLIFGDEILGIISIQSPLPNAWNETVLHAFETLANQASIAIYNSQSVKEVNDALDTLQNSFKASESITSELDPDKSLDKLVDSICNEFGAFRTCAILIDEDGKPYHLSASSGFDESFVLSSAFRVEGITLKVHQSGKPEFMEDVSDRGDEVNPKMIEQGVHAAAALPIIYKEEQLGVLWLHYKDAREFTEDDQKAITLFTSQAAIAYMNARLHQQIHRAQSTAGLVEQMIASGNLNQTLDSIVNGIKDVLGCDTVTLYTYRQEKNEFILPPATAGAIRYPEKIGGPLQPHTVPYKIIELDEILITEDSQHHPILGSPFAIRENVQACAAAPLKSQDKIVGVFFVNYMGRKHTFSPEDRQNINHFASQAVVAIQNAMLIEKEKKSREALRIIDKASRIITRSLQLNEIFENLAKQAINLTKLVGKPARFASINLYKNNQINLQIAYPKSEENKIILAGANNLDLMSGVNGRIGIIGRAICDKKPCLVRNVMEDPEYIQSHVETKCELVVPIIYENDVIGAINLEHDDVGGLDEDDLQNVHALAAHAAVAILNANMYQALQRKSKHQQAIYDVSNIINAKFERTEKDLLKLLVKQMVTTIIPAASAMNNLGTILLYYPDKNELVLECAFSEGKFGEIQIGDVRSLSDPSQNRIGIAGRTVIQKKPQRVRDVSMDPDYVKRHEKTKSELDVPMLEGDTVIGVLSLQCDQTDGFDEEAEKVMCAYAELAGIAIQKTRRYQEFLKTKAMVGNITAVAWMGLVAGAWRHSIGNMVTTIADLADLAQIHLENGEPREIVEQKLHKIKDIVSDVQKIPMPPLSSEAGVEPVLICQLVRDRVNQFKSKERYGSIKYELPFEINEDTLVRVSPEWLRRILDILIDNACEAMKKSPVKTIKIAMNQKDKGVEVLISDTGKGIPEHLQNKLFKEPISKNVGEKGSGIGLFLANTVIETFGGRIKVLTTGPTGTIMELWMPQYLNVASKV